MSVRIKTKKGTLPLHLALIETMSLEVIQFLLQAWPDAVRELDEDGCLPLHIAFMQSCTEDVIQVLAHSWPESCQIPNKQDELALHLACHYKSSELICNLLDCYPQAVRCKDNYLQLPIHIVCSRGMDLEVIEHLVRAWPESIQIACPYRH